MLRIVDDVHTYMVELFADMDDTSTEHLIEHEASAGSNCLNQFDYCCLSFLDYP